MLGYLWTASSCKRGSLVPPHLATASMPGTQWKALHLVGEFQGRLHLSVERTFFSLSIFGSVNLLARSYRTWSHLKTIGALFWKLILNSSKHFVTLWRKHMRLFIWGSFSFFWIWDDFWFSFLWNKGRPSVGWSRPFPKESQGAGQCFFVLF